MSRASLHRVWAAVLLGQREQGLWCRHLDPTIDLCWMVFDASTSRGNYMTLVLLYTRRTSFLPEQTLNDTRSPVNHTHRNKSLCSGNRVFRGTRPRSCQTPRRRGRRGPQLAFWVAWYLGHTLPEGSLTKVKFGVFKFSNYIETIAHRFCLDVIILIIFATANQNMFFKLCFIRVGTKTQVKQHQTDTGSYCS